MTGSRARAAILTFLVSDGRGAGSVTEIAAKAGLARYAVERELGHLIEGGLIRKVDIGPTAHALYQAVRSFPGFLELWRFVVLTSGKAARIREALAADGHQLAWIYGPYIEGAYTRKIPIVVITRAPKASARALQALRGSGFVVDATVMTIAQWSLRLERRDLTVLRLRKAQRLWLIGDSATLRKQEKFERETRRTWKTVLENWREEFLWDDDLDQFGRVLAPARNET